MFRSLIRRLPVIGQLIQMADHADDLEEYIAATGRAYGLGS
jgi:hypothetical protein